VPEEGGDIGEVAGNADQYPDLTLEIVEGKSALSIVHVPDPVALSCHKALGLLDDLRVDFGFRARAEVGGVCVRLGMSALKAVTSAHRLVYHVQLA
jgi:hypothetical protein